MSLPNNITVKDFFLEVAAGNVPRFALKEVIGVNSAVADTEDVWNAAANVATITHALKAAPLYISSTSVADTTQMVQVIGLDDNYDIILEVVKLNGRTAVVTTKAFLRVNSVTIDSVSAGIVYVFYNCAVTAGVPQTASKIQARIEIGTLQAYNAIYTVPRNKILYLVEFRYASSGSVDSNDVVLSIINTNETVEVIKYVDPGPSDYIDKQISFNNQPIKFDAKSEFRIQASLVDGTGLNITTLARFVEESLDVEDSTIKLYEESLDVEDSTIKLYEESLDVEDSTIKLYEESLDVEDSTIKLYEEATYLSMYEAPTTSVTYCLIGLPEILTATPTSFNLNNLLTTIEGEPTTHRVKFNTDVAFDLNYFTDGKLIITDKKAVLTVMRCVDSVAKVFYVLAPQNTTFSLENTKLVKYIK